MDEIIRLSPQDESTVQRFLGFLGFLDSLNSNSEVVVGSMGSVTSLDSPATGLAWRQQRCKRDLE